YFLDVMKLMLHMPFIRYVAVFVGEHLVVEVGQKPASGSHYRVRKSLYYQQDKQASMDTIFSLDEIRRPIKMIRLSMILTLLALAVLSSMLVVLLRVYGRLQQSEETKRLMIAAISHNAMHNLQPIYNKLYEMIEQQKGGRIAEPVLQNLRHIRWNMDSVKRILNDLKYNERLSRGEGIIRKKLMDVNECIAFTLRSYEHLIAKKSMEIKYTPCLDGQIIADKEIINSVVLNLVDNAMKYSPEKTRLEIECLEREGQLVIDVRDEGNGIPLAERERIFRPFFRLRQDRETVEGTGLGLSNARSMMRLHGGDLTVRENATGRGTTFSVQIQR
ncbi:sensor histidine kinase, partial [candidate division FCPU426 bacterium]|nr:sensor histidine kinase [candidate division FCPU426 bacterium]